MCVYAQGHRLHVAEPLTRLMDTYLLFVTHRLFRGDCYLERGIAAANADGYSVSIPLPMEAS